jgi:hypothetical protein
MDAGNGHEGCDLGLIPADLQNLPNLQRSAGVTMEISLGFKSNACVRMVSRNIIVSIPITDGVRGGRWDNRMAACCA